MSGLVQDDFKRAVQLATPLFQQPPFPSLSITERMYEQGFWIEFPRANLESESGEILILFWGERAVTIPVPGCSLISLDETDWWVLFGVALHFN